MIHETQSLSSWPILTTNVSYAVALILSLAAMVVDLKYRLIPNGLSVALLAGGSLSAMATRGWSGTVDALAGAAISFVVLLVPYFLGGMGGGDVKLAAGLGAWTGAGTIVPTLFLIAVLGAAMSLVYLAVSGLRKQITAQSIPYAPAIVLGSWIVIVSRAGGSRC